MKLPTAAREQATQRPRWSQRECSGVGPVGSGKTALVAALCRNLRDEVRLAVGDQRHTTDDADFLRHAGVLDLDRIVPVRTGCCPPHRDPRRHWRERGRGRRAWRPGFGPLDLVLVEGGGDNLTANFSRCLADLQIFVLDMSGGDKVPRKGGPGVTFSDLLVINKTDLALLVGASLEVMDRDAAAVRDGPPVFFTSLRGSATVSFLPATDTAGTSYASSSTDRSALARRLGPGAAARR